jgi:two-component system sensor histidine kinase/response regulator
MLSNHRILAVDDDPMNLDIIEEILEDKYLIERADSGEAVLKILPEFRPDLILLDIMMPGINGYIVCRKIRNDPEYDNLKIILVSGKAMAEERLKGYEAGADDYITKPFLEEELVAKVKVFLKLRKSEKSGYVMEKAFSDLSSRLTCSVERITDAVSRLESLSGIDVEVGRALEAISAEKEKLSLYALKANLLSKAVHRPVLNRIEGEIGGWLRQAAGKLESELHNNEIGLEYEFNEPINLTLDWTRLEEVFIPLLHGIVVASEKDRSIKVETGKDESNCRVRITSGKMKSGDNYEASDTLDLLTDDNMLHLCLEAIRHLIEAHGGSIECNTDEPSTLAINIILPLPSEEAVSEERPAAVSS